MNDAYDFGGIQFFGEGYFVFPDYPLDPARLPKSYGSPWELWVATLARARRGDATWVPGLLDLYLRSDDWVLKAQCCDLLADAAPATTVSRIRESIVAKLVHGDEYAPQFAVDMSSVLFAQMRLADVPLLLSIYRDGAQFEDTEIIICYMEFILGEIELVGGVTYLDSDSRLVSDRYEKLLDQYGTGEIRLWLGEPFIITRFARRWLNTGDVPDPITLRRIFESTTGIDSRPFFEDESFRPLTAAAIVEEFLESPAAGTYEQGVRYFFGHRISD